MSPYVCDCTNVVYMFCVYCIYYYVNKFEARSLFSTSHLKKICQKIKLHKFATTNNNFEKNDYFRHASLNLCSVNVYQFQQNRISRSVETVNTKLFANNRKLHKFVT